MDVKVLKVLESYSGYRIWAKKYNLHNFKYGKTLKDFLENDNENLFKVIAEGNHITNYQTKLLGIEHEDGSQFIVKESAVEKLSDRNGNLLLAF